MNAPTDSRTTHACAAEAAEWFVNLQATDIDREAQEAFADWLRRSPLHVEEFLQLTALQGDLSRLPELKDIDLPALLAEAGRTDTDNVIALANEFFPLREETGALGAAKVQVVTSVSAERPAARELKGWWLAAAAAIALVCVGVARLGAVRNFFNSEHYSTAVGEQRSVALTDGSQIELNVRSSLSAQLTETARDIRLEGGEALFQVAKDPTRPFRVHTPQATIEATGTRFNVHVKSGITVVALLEGRIEVRQPGEAVAIPLNPGQEITLAAHTTARPAPRPADLKTVTAWTERRLVFEDTPIAEVIEEFNRYSRQPLEIDPRLRDVRITISFDSGSTQTFAESLAAAGGLRVTRTAAGSWRIERKE